MSARAFWAGTSEATITPPVGAPLIGPMAPSTGVHDDLYARALVLGDGERRVAIVCMDLLGLDFITADEIRAEIRRKTGIAVTLLSCTHTHSTPFTVPWNHLCWGWCEGEGRPWMREMAEKAADAVVRAAGALREASLRAGRAPAQVGSNRRLPTEKGIVMKPNPDGAIVPWVDVLRVDGTEGKPIAVLFSHAAHPVIVHGASTLISADYPGYAVKEIERRFGGAKALFAEGCCGNINGDPLRGGFEAAERAGLALAEAAMKAAQESEPLAGKRLSFTSATMDLPFRDFPPIGECERALREAEGRLGKNPSPYARADVICFRELLEMATLGKKHTLRFEANTLSVGGEWGLLTMTHEVFAEYQLWFEETAPFRRKMVWAYTNGCESYIPTDRDFALGGYEAGAFPVIAAPLRYRHRVALQPGIEQQIKECVGGLMGR